MPNRPDGLIMAFGMSNLQIATNIEKLESKYDLELGHKKKTPLNRKLSDYEQFEIKLRQEASRMSELYEVFYCLENSIRKLVADVMVDAEGADWWLSSRVDEDRIRNKANKLRQKEVDSGITPRSENLIDYTTFGELSQLITDNWDLFDPIFSSKTAVSNVTNQLNLLRGPIAHCCPTDDLEQERLSLAVKSWFKIMS